MNKKNLRHIILENPLKNKIHMILGNSYYVYFILFLVGLFLDFSSVYKPVSNKIFGLEITGFIFMFCGSMFIIWAQMTSHTLEQHKKQQMVSKESFFCGPYRYSRHPTHLGVFLLVIGFSFVSNAFFVFIFAIIALLISKLTFLKNQDLVLEKKYGDAYREYKRMIR